MEYSRKKGETVDDWLYRLYRNQEIYELSNKEIGDVANLETGYDYDESAYRKKYTQRIIGYDKGYKDGLKGDTSSILEKIEHQKDELYKQQVRTRDWCREKRKILRDEARIENLKNYFKEAYENAPDFYVERYEKKHRGEAVAISLLSDFHVGLEIKNYWNTYNKDIFEDRLQTLIYKIINYTEIMNIGTLYVASLGDMISGSIHGTTRLAEEMDVLDQTMYVAKAIKNMLFELADFGLNIKYISVVGNHDRVNKNYKEHIEKESFIKMVDWYLADKIEDTHLPIEIINNVIDEEISLFNIGDKKCIAVHGHNDNVNSIVKNMIAATKEIPDYIFLGHYHRKISIDDNGLTKIFVNGALVGVDDYAKKKRYYSKPCQTLIVFDENNDVLDITLGLKGE